MKILININGSFNLSLIKYLKKFDLAPVYSQEEFEHWFVPRKDIIDTFVVENNGVITDICSYYHLPSSIMQHPQHKTLKAAYSFYNVATKTPLLNLINDCLIMAKKVSLSFIFFSFFKLVNLCCFLYYIE